MLWLLIQCNYKSSFVRYHFRSYLGINGGSFTMIQLGLHIPHLSGITGDNTQSQTI
jgi:hypothetical protein